MITKRTGFKKAGESVNWLIGNVNPLSILKKLSEKTMSAILFIQLTNFNYLYTYRLFEINNLLCLRETVTDLIGEARRPCWDDVWMPSCSCQSECVLTHTKVF